MIFLRECYIYFYITVGFLAYKLLLKAGDKCTTTDFKLVILALTAFKSLTVSKTLKVDYSYIAVLYCAVVNSYESCILLSCSLYILIYILVCYSIVNFIHFYTLVIAKSYLRLSCNKRGEHNRLTLLYIFNVNLRSCN